MTDAFTHANSESPEIEPEFDWLLDQPNWQSDAQSSAEPREPAVEPGRRESVRSAIAWLTEVARGLLDLRFRRPATRTLLPLVYVLGLAGTVIVPLALSLPVFGFSIVLGVLYLIVVAPVLILTGAATVRLLLEFLISTTQLAGKVNHITAIADDLMTALTDVAQPIGQLSEDVRAVQFWRFRNRRRRGL
ncbi:DUF4282 domain-containing protein [Skermania piniformis]|uniref:DUF4282 domain-containing protein n=1 Tax=Skermania pinensis TaxID=39122 RepID=UPI00082E62B1|nr:DUF4282 domain-containing protein [Skermania piniformis]